MRAAAMALRWFGGALGLLIAAVGFGLLQTQAGKTWLAGTILRAVSSPDFSVTMKGLGGIVPFRLGPAIFVTPPAWPWVSQSRQRRE